MWHKAKCVKSGGHCTDSDRQGYLDATATPAQSPASLALLRGAIGDPETKWLKPTLVAFRLLKKVFLDEAVR